MFMQYSKWTDQCRESRQSQSTFKSYRVVELLKCWKETRDALKVSESNNRSLYHGYVRWKSFNVGIGVLNAGCLFIERTYNSMQHLMNQYLSSCFTNTFSSVSVIWFLKFGMES